MKDYKKNRFILFTNDGKKERKQPDYRGSSEITEEMVGEELELAGWVNEDKNGNQYISGTIKIKKAKNDAKEKVEEEIPF